MNNLLCKPNGETFTYTNDEGTWFYFISNGILTGQRIDMVGTDKIGNYIEAEDEIHPSYNVEQYNLNDFEQEISEYFEVDGLYFSCFTKYERMVVEGYITRLSDLIGTQLSKTFLVDAWRLHDPTEGINTPWDFKSDYEKNFNEYIHYGLFIRDAQAQFIIYKDRSTSVKLGLKCTDWSSMEGHFPTGNDEGTIFDIHALWERGKILCQ